MEHKYRVKLVSLYEYTRSPQTSITETQIHALAKQIAAQSVLPSDCCWGEILAFFNIGYSMHTRTSKTPTPKTSIRKTPTHRCDLVFHQDNRKCTSCFESLSHGRCNDNFIKNTLGTILYPQHYGKQK